MSPTTHDPEHHAAGHAEHFLARLDRLDDPHVTLSLSLYRDHELVRDLLAQLDVPEGTARVAFALDTNEAPPHVLVTRDGHFVTALAKGMSPTDCYVVARTRLDALTARVQTFRERMALAHRREAVRGREHALRFMRAGANATREDYESVEPFVRILPGQFWSSWLQHAAQVHHATDRLASIDRPRGAQITALRAYHEDLYALAHLGLLCTEPGTRDAIDVIPDEMRRRFQPLACAIDAMHPGVTLRSLAAMARIGKPMLAAAKRNYLEAPNLPEMHRAMLTLLAIALRQRKYEAEVTKALLSAGETASPLHAFRASLRENIAKICGETFSVDPEVSKAVLMGHAVEHLRAEFAKLPERVRPDAGRLPRDLLAAFGLDWFPRPARPGERLSTVLAVLPWAASADATEFYLPESSRLLTKPYDADETLAILRDLRAAPAPPKRSEPKPGRNDPCPCGSGKKYKKCHGA